MDGGPGHRDEHRGRQHRRPDRVHAAADSVADPPRCRGPPARAHCVAAVVLYSVVAVVRGEHQRSRGLVGVVAVVVVCPGVFARFQVGQHAAVRAASLGLLPRCPPAGRVRAARSSPPGPGHAGRRSGVGRIRGFAVRGSQPRRTGIGRATAVTAARSCGLMDWSSRARTDCATRRPPVTRMLIPTMTATTGSSRCHPVTATSSTPTSTPTEVHTSVIRCLPSAVSVAERRCRPTRIRQPAHYAVDQGGEGRYGQAETDAVERRRVDEPVDRADQDHRGRGEDHQPF